MGEAVDETEPIDLSDLVEACWQNVDTASATFVAEIDAIIYADRSQFTQLLENLFHNAVEHGGEDVTIMIGDLDDETGFYVADDGPGIPEDERDRIFEFGYATGERGTGFGLAIVEEIADRVVRNYFPPRLHCRCFACRNTAPVTAWQ